MNAQNQAVTRIVNPLNNGNQVVHQGHSKSALISAESQRAIAEVQAALAIAKSFPRDRVAAVDRILNDCQRSGLAEVAIFQYSRGGTSINGPTIRLAESLAQNWGNIQYGIRELSQENGESTVEAFAWDVETNTRQTKVFQVPHVRYTRSGGAVKLTDPRDIYETVANNGARRLRACILGVIPGDIVDAALQQCELTLNTYADTSPEGIQKIIKAFEKYGVSKEALEKRIQCRMEAIKPAQIVSLTKIGTSIKDGMSNASDWFEMNLSTAVESQSMNEDVSEFALLKHSILTIKSIDDLNACEEKAMDHTNKEERKQLMALIKAQAKKFESTQEVLPKKKPKAEPVKEAENVVEVKITAKPSDELRKEYSLRMNNAETKGELNELLEFVKADEHLTEAHVEYLRSVYAQCKEKFAPKTQPAETPKVDIKGDLLTLISNTKDVQSLEEVAKQINAVKKHLNSEDLQEVMLAYAQRKEMLSQADIFADASKPVKQVSYVESVIARIQAAKTQDDINAEYADPAIEELSDKERQQIDLAAGKREMELQKG